MCCRRKMGFSGVMLQFLRACCGKKKSKRTNEQVENELPTPSTQPSPLVPPTLKPVATASVRSAQKVRQWPDVLAGSAKSIKSMKSTKSRKIRRPSTSASTTSSQISTKSTKSKSKSRRSSGSRNKMLEEGGIQVEDSTTSRKRKGKTQRSANNRQRESMLDSSVLRTQLKKFVAETLKTGVAGLVEQFVQLKAVTAMPPPKTVFDANRARNRYKDVICSDRTRVVLKWPVDAPSDYIHANWVEFKGEKKFICTQAPIVPTIDDFWRLVWQEKCKSIVMLCELVEQNKRKCEAYWPSVLHDTMETASGLCIKNTKITSPESSLTVSTLEITCKYEQASEPLVLSHYKWNDWPDRGVPENCIAPFRLLNKLTADPVIIHCSAGIGRTGTIVGLHMALKVLHSGEDLVLANLVKELRASRHGSVQTDTQFLYMHRALMQLAENMSLVSAEEVEQFSQDYNKFIKDRGC